MIAKRPTPASPKRAPSPQAYVAVAGEPPAENDFDRPMATRFLRTLDSVRVVEVPGNEACSLAPSYRREDLLAIAEVAYGYLFTGGARLALVIFEGLAAIAPAEPYFMLALGLTHDRANDRAQAKRCYARAAELDPTDGRADINHAELLLEEGDLTRAKALFTSGAAKAARRGDRELENKARALIEQIEKRRPR